MRLIAPVHLRWRERPFGKGYWIVGGVMLVLSVAASAQRAPYDGKQDQAQQDAINACSYYVAAVASRSDQTVFAEKAPGWRLACEQSRHPLPCEDANADLKKGQVEGRIRLDLKLLQCAGSKK